MKLKNLSEHLSMFAKGPKRQLALRQVMDMKTKDFIEAFGLGEWTNIVSDAAHQRAIKAYEQFPTIWQNIVYIDPTITDFKAHNLLGAGEFSDLGSVGELEGYALDTFGDKKVAITVGKYGKLFATSLEARMNDALGLLERRDTKMMQAAARTVEKHILQTMIRDNPTVQEDSKVLFHADHTNDVGTSGGYTREGLIAAITLMCDQTGLDGSEQIYMMPKFLLVPTAKQFQAREDLESAGKIIVNRVNDALAVQGANNDLQSMGIQVLTSPYLTTDACYLVADPMACEGLTLGFLNNQRTPELLTENEQSGFSFSHDAVRHKMRHIWGSAWADHRAIARFGV